MTFRPANSPVHLLRARRHLLTLVVIWGVLAAFASTSAGAAPIDGADGENEAQHYADSDGHGRSGLRITEFGYMMRVDIGPKWHGSEFAEYRMTWDFGWLDRLSERSALGGSAYASVGSEGARFGLRPRYRRWLSRAIGLDVSPGILIAGVNAHDDIAKLGFLGQIDVTFSDWVAVSTSIEVTRFSNGGRDVAWYGGGKIGSTPGLVAGVVIPLTVLTIIARNADWSFD